MKKLWCAALGFFAAVPLVLLVWGFGLPAQYGGTFLGELSAKRALLAAESQKPRIVIVGGSAAAFGVDSALLEAELPQYEVVNFGLYAALGTRVMLDLSINDLREGDIVIVMPEQQEQALSDYLGAEAMWQAADGDFSALSALHWRDVVPMLGSFAQFAGRKFGYFVSGGLRLEGVYQKASFNAKGDVVSAECAANIMPNGWDASTPISFDTSMPDADFCAALNEYTAALAARGVTVWYHFPPMNAAAVEEDSDVDAYAAALQQKLSCSLAGNPNACVMASGWFYDTNFHLNASGKTVFTRQLVRDCKAMLGDTSPTDIALPAEPEPAAAAGSAAAQYDNTNADCFVYEAAGDGLRITGLTERGKASTVLVLPAEADGRAVTAIEAGALDGAAARSITVQANLTYLPDGAFGGCTALSRVIILQPDPAALRVGTALLDGAPESCRIAVPEESYTAYCLNYSWGVYAQRIDKYKE